MWRQSALGFANADFFAELKQIPAEYYEAAPIDDAGPWSKFTRITLPLLTPMIFFNLITFGR